MSHITVFFSGHVHGTPRSNVTKSGVAVVNFRVHAVRKNGLGEDVIEEIRCAAFDLAADAARDLKEGDRVHGYGQQRTTQAGTEIAVDKLETP